MTLNALYSLQNMEEDEILVWLQALNLVNSFDSGHLKGSYENEVIKSNTK